MLWKRLSVTKKLFAAIAGTTIIIIAVMAGLVAYSMRAGFSQYLLEAELDRFDNVVVALEEAYDPAVGGWPKLNGTKVWRTFVRENLRPPPESRRLQQEAGGKARPQRPRRHDPLQLGSRLALLGGDNQVIAGELQGNASIVRRPIMAREPGSDPTRVGWLALSEPEGGAISADHVFLKGQFRSLIMTALLAIALSAGAAFLLARQFLTPVRDLMDGAQDLAAGSYGTRMENRRGDEFGTLIDHFNQLAESLEVAEKAERQWISDASHELQTPLAVLRAEIEALQDGVRQADEKTLADIHCAIMRLSRLVGDLNALSHAREGRLVTLMAEEDLCAIARDAIEGVLAAYQEKGLVLDLKADDEIILSCDRLRIRQLLDNLLENARRYTDAPGKVSLTVVRSGNTAVIDLEDTAPAPPRETLAKLFDRFYRAESSRARQHGGSGLGLAICRAIVLAHGGTISAALSDLGGLKITVTLTIDLTEDT